MEKHVCKLCDRSFINGRALGGHMRSHLVAARPAAASMKSPLAADYSSSSTSSREAEEGKGLGYGLRENPKKSFRMVDPEFSFAFTAGSSVVQDRESETESPLQATDAAFSYKGGRSKRTRRSEAASELLRAELLSSYSDTSPEVDLAITFMLLSRDVWNRYEEEEYEAGEEEEEEEEEAAAEVIEVKPQPSPAKGRSRFQCGTCKKVFRSYQALGGHRASHKKSRSCVPPADDSRIIVTVSPETNADGKSAVHVCLICFREFACGQALGGHKRSHQLSSPAATVNITSPPRTAKLRECLFDLNLPAPLDDDAELSAVSEAELVNSGPL